MSSPGEAWEAIAAVRTAIDEHPFLTGLRDGTLAQGVFLGYLAQDAVHLAAWRQERWPVQAAGLPWQPPCGLVAPERRAR